jgi:hypothetical protein
MYFITFVIGIFFRSYLYYVYKMLSIVEATGMCNSITRTRVHFTNTPNAKQGEIL